MQTLVDFLKSLVIGLFSCPNEGIIMKAKFQGITELISDSG